MKEYNYDDEKGYDKEEEVKDNYAEKHEHTKKHVIQEKIHISENKEKKEDNEEFVTKPIIILIVIAALLLLFNQYQISTIKGMVGTSFSGGSGLSGGSGSKDLANLDLNKLKSTAQTVATVFPVENIKTSDDAMAMMLPTGIPDYGAELGVTFDEPVQSLDTLSKMYKGLKAEVQKNNPEGWKRFMNMASKPLGMSCEYCCGIGTIGIDKNGNSACGCQHNPALLTVGLYLSSNSNYNDGEILREVMKWKTLFFPKDMIQLGMSVAGSDASSLSDLPGMVGGC